MVEKNPEPAFPGAVDSSAPPGMSLRDWFAGQALTGLLLTQRTSLVAWEQMSSRAYGLADAMLAERTKP